MAQLTMAQAYAYARQAGFDPASAVIAAAIAAGESGLRTDARGDVQLQDATWGPSVGLMQIRTLKSDTGTGKTRDIQQLSDPLQNMVAAYNISSHGKDWTPWTVYNTGKYRQFLGQASSAAGAYVPAVAGDVVTTAQPVSWAGDILSTGKDWSVRLLVAALGVGLVVAGTYRAWSPAVRGVRRVAKKAAVGVATGGAGAAAA